MALSPVNSINGVHESPMQATDPSSKTSALEKVEEASMMPAVGTPMNPDSIHIHPPSGTPPPPNGQLLDDVKLAEEESPAAVDMDVDMSEADHPEAPDEKLLNGIHGQSSNVNSPASPPPESQRESPLQTQPSQDASVADSEERPAKRPRKMSEEPSGVNGISSPVVATPATPSTSAPLVNSVSTQPPVPQSTIPMSQVQHRFCISTVRTLKKLKDAIPFLHPVDPIALGIPHYPNVIKQPMDLGTVERKLISSNPSKPDPAFPRPPYISTDEFIYDVKLIFNNCATFNGPDHIITQMGRRLEAVFDKQTKQLPANEEPPKPIPIKAATPPAQLKKVPQRRASTSVPTIRRSEFDQQGRPKREIHPPASKDLPYSDAPRKARRTKGKRDDGSLEQLRFCSKLLQSLHSKSLYNTAVHFYEPVDHVKLGIPSYPKIIKRPMDMATMKRKLDAGEYSNAQKFYDDFKLMIRNCFMFNPEGTLVNQAGVELQKVFDDKWKALPPLREVNSDEAGDTDEGSDEEAREQLVAQMESQIESLNRNLAAIKRKPKEKKKEVRKDKPAVPSGSVPKGQPNKPPAPGRKKSGRKADDALSFEQKKDLSDTIATLEGSKLERVIQIIHEGVPEIRDSTEEIELDIDSLPQSVLMKLYNFVLRPIRTNPPKRSRGVGGGTGGLKRKSMDEDVEAERIRQLEERIALFNGEPVPTSGVARAPGSAQSSDNSSDESSGSDSE